MIELDDIIAFIGYVDIFLYLFMPFYFITYLVHRIARKHFVMGGAGIVLLIIWIISFIYLFNYISYGNWYVEGSASTKQIIKTYSQVVGIFCFFVCIYIYLGTRPYPKDLKEHKGDTDNLTT